MTAPKLLALLGLGLLLVGQPALAYRPLSSSVVTNVEPTAPVTLTASNGSFQDTSTRLNGLLISILTLRREQVTPETELRAISSLEVELVLLGSQGDVLETIVTPIVISTAWSPLSSRQIRLEREYLGWPATNLRARLLQVTYTTGDPWRVAAPTEAEVPATPSPQANADSLNLSTDSPFISPKVLFPGGSSGGGNGDGFSNPSRPVRPRPIRPRPGVTPTGYTPPNIPIPSPPPLPGGTVNPNTSPFTARPSPFGTGTSTSSPFGAPNTAKPATPGQPNSSSDEDR